MDVFNVKIFHITDYSFEFHVMQSSNGCVDFMTHNVFKYQESSVLIYS